MKIYAQILEELETLKNPAQAAHLSRFFKTGKGQYGEGDVFLGIRVPAVRAVVRRYAPQARTEDAGVLLKSPYHEARLCGVLLLVALYERAKTPAEKERICAFYTAHLERANNWDLIDLSVYKILGAHLYGRKDDAPLRRLAQSNNLWRQRASIVATLYFIKRGEFATTLALAEKFLTHPHDLMHKACGWMLREVGKKDEAALCAFLDKFHKTMPRTMLRYSLEKLSEAKRAHYMAR